METNENGNKEKLRIKINKYEKISKYVSYFYLVSLILGIISFALFKFVNI